ncbi:MAG TPA: mannose-6-phosphate isomerase, class I [Micromonosporaceae bacterium]|nr:mannose-6-phosphate isomerase, class I [Micromonosporaceae bacterium]
MRLLQGSIRGYAWGSRTAIATLQGRPVPTPEPEAELWLGAHPSAPALVRDGLAGDGAAGRPLTDIIAADPAGVLGDETVAQFGQRLPFLLKVLAAAQPLSLQAHPDLDQARAGFAAEQAAGADPSARNYVDDWHKPELLVAVEPFDALCGFRDPSISADLLGALDLPALRPAVAALRAADPATGLRDAVHGLLTLPAEDLPALVDLVAERAADLLAARAVDGAAVDGAAVDCAAVDGAAVDGAAVDAVAHASYRLVTELAQRYPGDAGVLVAMLLNRVTLQPGEAVWMPAGNLHAYLAGVGVEIMAASDNVLRGGLTPKHVDVAELLRILRFEVLDTPVLRPTASGPGVVTWPVPVADFTLHRAAVAGDAPVRLPGGGPRILLCLRGSVQADDGAGSVLLHGGQAAFAPASAGPIEVRVNDSAGTAEVYQAGTGT